MHRLRRLRAGLPGDGDFCARRPAGEMVELHASERRLVREEGLAARFATTFALTREYRDYGGALALRRFFLGLSVEAARKLPQRRGPRARRAREGSPAAQSS